MWSRHGRNGRSVDSPERTNGRIWSGVDSVDIGDEEERERGWECKSCEKNHDKESVEEVCVSACEMIKRMPCV